MGGYGGAKPPAQSHGYRRLHRFMRNPIQSISMGLNRTPTAILEARGSFINHKNRKAARAGEPVVTKRLGSPPKTCTDEQKKIWREFAKIVPPGVATHADRWAVEIV